jgi:L-lactate dehydrogenase complex protein LldE
MLKLHYPQLLDGSDEEVLEARGFAERVHELTEFLVNVRGMTSVPGRPEGRAVYHDACSGLRELGIAREPRRLLASIEGLELAEMPDREACCGFGGLFCVKYPEISNALVEKKAAAISAIGPDIVLGGDIGCLMNIAGKLKRSGSPVRCRHVAEVLAGELADPPLAYAD